MLSEFLSNYRYLFLCGAVLLSQPAIGQDDFFSLLDSDSRYELTLEAGPSFISDPVFKSYDGADGIHPATRISLKLPRHISGAWAFRLNDWLRLEASLVFNAVDFESASSADEAAEMMFRDNVKNNIRCGNAPFEDFSDYEDCDQRSIYQRVHASADTIYRSTRPQAAYDDAYDDYLTNTQEYQDALAMDDCDAACARMMAEADDDVSDAAEAAGTTARDQKLGELDEDVIDEIARIAAGESDLAPDRDEYTAEGTFLNLSGFLGAYADIPLSRGFWFYGGGGGGIAWSHVKDGAYTRQSYFDLDIDALQDSIDDEPSNDLETDELIAIGNNLERLIDSRSQQSDITSTEVSLAFTAQAGFRSEVFDDLVFDSGYQMIWAQDLFENADEQIIHIVRIGLVFTY